MSKHAAWLAPPLVAAATLALAADRPGSNQDHPADDAGSPPTVAAPVEMIRDPSWRSEPGAEGTIVEPDVPAAKSYEQLTRYLKADLAKDHVGRKRLMDDKSVVLMPEGTGVLVIKRVIVRTYSVSSAPLSGVDLARQTQADILSGPDPNPELQNALEVRFTDGPLKDEVRFIPIGTADRMIEKPPPPPPPEPAKRPRPKVRKPTGPPPTDAERAAQWLQFGRDMERQGNARGAMGMYRDLVERFPDSSQAEAARERLKALGVDVKSQRRASSP